MHIKRYEAATMAEAIAQIREELGSEALILQSRQVRREGLFGALAKPVVEVTAAIDREARRESSPSNAGDSGDRNWREIQIAKALMDPLESQVKEVRESVQSLTLGGSGALTIAAEVAELKRWVANIQGPELNGIRGQAANLIRSGLEPRHAYTLAAEASAREAEDPDHATLMTLASRLENRLIPPRDDDPPITLVVGPTGSGKTTSLAKAAGRERAAQKDLAVVTTDAHRYGAELLLRRFSRDLDVPFDVAVSPESLAERAKRYNRRSLFVDTAGRSPRDPQGIPELRALRGALGDRAQVQLVLSATTKSKDLGAQVACFSPLEPDGLIITRTDESSDLLNVVNLLLDDGTPPLRFVGSGQKVPEDLQVPDPMELAQAVLGASL